MKYRKHVFVCSNQKPDGRKCCGETNGLELMTQLRTMAKEAGLTDVRVQKAGCLDACGFGPAMVVYPEGTFYGKVGLEDLESILQRDLIEGGVVEEKVIIFPVKA